MNRISRTSLEFNPILLGDVLPPDSWNSHPIDLKLGTKIFHDRNFLKLKCSEVPASCPNFDGISIFSTVSTRVPHSGVGVRHGGCPNHRKIFFETLSPRIKTDAPYRAPPSHLKMKPPPPPHLKNKLPPYWNLKHPSMKWFLEKSTINNLKSS